MPELPEAERARGSPGVHPRTADRPRPRRRHLRLAPARAGGDRRRAGRPHLRHRPSPRQVPVAGDRRRTGAGPASRHGGPDRASTAARTSRGGTASPSSSTTGRGWRCATSAGWAARYSTRTSATSAPTPRTSAATSFAGIVGAGRTAVKARLLNQGAISGVGNLLADQALWQARIAPTRVTSSLSDEELDRLRRELRSAVRSAIRKGGRAHRGVHRRPRPRGPLPA